MWHELQFILCTGEALQHANMLPATAGLQVIQETASGQSLHEMDVEGREGGTVRHALDAVSDMMHKASQAAQVGWWSKPFPDCE